MDIEVNGPIVGTQLELMNSPHETQVIGKVELGAAISCRWSGLVNAGIECAKEHERIGSAQGRGNEQIRARRYGTSERIKAGHLTGGLNGVVPAQGIRSL